MKNVRTGIAFVPHSLDSHPCLDHLSSHRHKAETAAYCGVRLTEMTRDELLALAALFCEKEIERYRQMGMAYPVDPPSGTVLR